MQKKPISLNFVLIAVILLFMFGSRIISLIVDYMWFDALGYKQIFLIPLYAKIILFLVFSFITFIIFFINDRVAFHLQKDKIPLRQFRLLLNVLASFIIGSFASSGWEIYLKYANGHNFYLLDPIFQQDIGFYVFILPFLTYITTILLLILVTTGIWVSVIYLWKELKQMLASPGISGNDGSIIDIKPIKTNKNFDISISAKNHLFILASLFFLLVAIKHYLARYAILFSQSGVVFGAGYADVHAALPITNILVGVSVLIAFLFFVKIFFSSKRLKRRHILLGLGALYIFTLLLGLVIPALVQSYMVNPNEFSLEEQYIKHNIQFTNSAYGLDKVKESFFAISDESDINILKRNLDVIKKLRILDWRPLTQTYKQLQEIRLYYDFADVDIDRYTINGTATQVMLSARELNVNQLRNKAKTWLNEHLIFTHGYGIVMSPVNKISKEGLPEFIIKDIPPESKIFSLTRPEIYYGEIDNGFVMVNTNIEEFDYPKGDLNQYTKYAGTGGIVIDSFMKKILLALYFGDINIILNNDITAKSKILFTRQIQQRIRKIAPFLALDSDPYVVIINGRIMWIQDAYTLTDRFPYSDPISGFNYMRNSVKIVIDAYDGSVDFYLADPKDPIIKTYKTIFPGLFKNIKDAPPELRDHFRYPEDFFKVQVAMFSTYHMKDPKVFYNREDLWNTPNEIFGQGKVQEMTPYYVLLKEPEDEVYVIIIPFTPINKDNMIAWISGRLSFQNESASNDIILYKFPKDKLIFGPAQIEARIDQDSEISEQLTLWSQRGSNVIRGNLLVIPIENSLLYVEPLYITADNSEIPELKRIILSYGTKIVMEKDIEAALNAIFGSRTGAKRTSQDLQPDDLAANALQYYNKVQDAMENKDWEGIGKNMKLLEDVLNEMAKP